MLNFALAVARTKAALSALLRQDPSIHWHRVKYRQTHDILFSIRNTLTELSLSLGLLALGAFAMITNSFSGGFWLLWYGVMYMAATVLMYKYG